MRDRKVKRERELDATKALILRVAETGGRIESILVSHHRLGSPRWFLRTKRGRWVSMINGRVGDTPIKKWYVLSKAIDLQVAKHETPSIPVRIHDFGKWVEKKALVYVAKSLRECQTKMHRELWTLVNQLNDTVTVGKIIAEVA
jgi:hypothetical protein